jgi:hypothetical protein
MYDAIDRWTMEHAGIDYTIELYYDADSTPMDYDCYSAEDVNAWTADRWEYVGVIVSAYGEQDSLWGVQMGDGDGWSVGKNDIEDYPVLEMVHEIRHRLAMSRDDLYSLGIGDDLRPECEGCHVRSAYLNVHEQGCPALSAAFVMPS